MFGRFRAQKLRNQPLQIGDGTGQLRLGDQFPGSCRQIDKGRGLYEVDRAGPYPQRYRDIKRNIDELGQQHFLDELIGPAGGRQVNADVMHPAEIGQKLWRGNIV